MDLDLMARRISKEIDKRDLSKKEVADSLGVSDVTLSHWINGRRFPTLQQLEDLSKLFGVTIDYLLGISENAGRYTSLSESTGLTDKAIKNLRFISQSSEALAVLNKLLESSALYSTLANYSKVIAIREKLDGRIQKIDFPPELIAEVSKYSCDILSDAEIADFRENQVLDQIKRILRRG